MYDDDFGVGGRAEGVEELVEALGVGLDAVLTVCRRLGIRGAQSRDLTPDESARIRSALGQRAPHPAVPQPRPRVPEPTPPPAAPPAPEKPTGLAAHYEARLREAHVLAGTLREEVRALRAENERLKAGLAKASASRPPPPAPAPSSEARPLAAFMGDQGYEPVAGATAVTRLLTRAGTSARVLDALSVRDAQTVSRLLERYVAPCCGHPDCLREVVEVRGADPVEATPGECSVCAGSDNRRAVAGMVSACAEAGVRRVLVVGGGPDTHTALRNTVDGALDLRIVDGTADPPLSRAKQDVRGRELVVVWGGTILNHSTSGVYQRAARGAGVRLVPVQQRGVRALADAVRAAVLG